ncbi:hypothetical protein QKO65_gp1 [Auricularia heimuer negative-stranded RNA virus 1]|uniref:Uncharacterized protein n=1 Tax=Auricularia heimuer negative-stranded RNA virus 1 TaxID=2732257 RepID=A0A6M3Z5S6_9MONO|nr:hypothetical protein QKO65_gp1 [Auricularia heimuer negative-stranded RNA virus 1]QJP04104.1 hypothetical protein [Auricularia heimuer negative-stranded RNA virus 1]
MQANPAPPAQQAAAAKPPINRGARRVAMVNQQAGANTAAQTAQSLAAVFASMSVPRPSNAQVAPSKAAKVGRPVVYEIRPDQDPELAWGFFRYMNLACRTTTIGTRQPWESLFCTYLRMLWRDELSRLDGKDWVVRDFDPQEASALRAIVKAHTVAAGPTSPEARKVLKAELKALDKIGLPKPLAPVSLEDVEKTEEFIEMYALAGVICMAASKLANAPGATSLTDARPQALGIKYSLTAASAPSLLGNLRTSVEVLTELNQFWTRQSGIRRLLFTYLAGSAHRDTSTYDEAAFTTFRLMKWATHAHVALILEFLRKYPNATWCPVLRNEIVHFRAGLENLYAECPAMLDKAGLPIRNADGSERQDLDLLPYLKIIHGDKRDLIKKNEVAVLLYVAVEFLKLEAPSLGAYTVTPTYAQAYTDVVQFFRDVDAEAQRLDEEEDEAQAAGPGP